MSDWCGVRSKWVDWSFNEKEAITVPEVYRPDKIHWNNKTFHNLVREETVSNKRRSTTLSYNARRLVRNNKIYFWQPNCVDGERSQQDRCCGPVVMSWIKIIDPFCQQGLTTDVEDNEWYVSYRQLRNKRCARHWIRNWLNWTRSRFRIWHTSPIRQKASPCDKCHSTDATSRSSLLASQCWRWRWINICAL